jgi:hypothetical protein
MPKGPHGQKRSQSPTQAALQVAKIATGQTKETPSNRHTIHLAKKKSG